MRAVLDGRTVIDTERALLVHRPGGPPVWAFPPDDVDDGVAPSVCGEAAGYVEVPWGAGDTWLQEEDEVRLHAPNPYHRVEYVRTQRRVRATSPAGEVLVDTAAAIAVYDRARAEALRVPRSRAHGSVRAQRQGHSLPVQR